MKGFKKDFMINYIKNNKAKSMAIAMVTGGKLLALIGILLLIFINGILLNELEANTSALYINFLVGMAYIAGSASLIIVGGFSAIKGSAIFMMMKNEDDFIDDLYEEDFSYEDASSVKKINNDVKDDVVNKKEVDEKGFNGESFSAEELSQTNEVLSENKKDDKKSKEDKESKDDKKDDSHLDKDETLEIKIGGKTDDKDSDSKKVSDKK